MNSNSHSMPTNRGNKRASAVPTTDAIEARCTTTRGSNRRASTRQKTSRATAVDAHKARANPMKPKPKPKSKQKPYKLTKEQRKRKSARRRQLRAEKRSDSIPLESFKVEATGDGDDEISNLVKDFCVETFIPEIYKNSIYNIVPGTNPACMNFQSPQPMRFFFSYHAHQKLNPQPERYTFCKSTEQRYIYGPMAVLQSHGMHPDDFKVRPFCGRLKKICDLLIKKIKADSKYTDDVD